jgi:enoyl-CoA hydratase
MTYAAIDFDSDGHVATITLNRPEARNALSTGMKAELADALGRIEAADDISVLVITGAGDKAFCAGADIRERLDGGTTPAEFAVQQRRTVSLFSRIADLRIPTIAAINGAAVGGGAEIALCCDFRVAADQARFGLPEINLGVIPSGGGTQRLARLIGAGGAKRLVLTGAILDAGEARRLGLFDEVVPPTELQARTRELADSLATKAPLALRVAKQVIDEGAATSLEAGLELELQGAALLFATEDREEGMRAFVEKRAPKFRGR